MTNPSLLTFPCDFPIKIFGNAGNAFETAVVSIIRKHFPNVSETGFQMKPSTQGKYMAITVVVHTMSQNQLDETYKELSANENIIMVL